MTKLFRLSLASLTLFSIFALFVAQATYLFARPQFGMATVVSEEAGTTIESALPIRFSATGPTIVRLPFTLHSLYPRTYHLTPDDCLEKLWINDQEIQEGLPMCDLDRGKTFDFSSYLQKGENTVIAQIHNNGGAGVFALTPAANDSLLLVLRFLIALLVGMSFICFLMLCKRKRFDLFLGTIFLGGTLLRLVYAVRTPFDVRAYDAVAHAEYIWHFLNHGRIPAYDAGWEFFQPPLYYGLSALLALPFTFLGFDRTFVLELLQLQSVLLSSMALGFGIWIICMLFPKKDAYLQRRLFATVLAVFPGLVFAASRISNDVLLLTFSFGFFAFLYRWWQKGEQRDWLVACGFIIDGMLTKASAIVWIPILLLSLLLRKDLRARMRLSLATIALLLIFIGSGWFYAYRFIVEKQTHIIGNIASNGPEVRIANTVTLANFVALRPIALLKNPLANVRDETYGVYFWEYLLQTSIAGEWYTGNEARELAQIILLLFMILAVFGLFAFFDHITFDPRQNAPLWLTGGFLVGSMMTLVTTTPIAGLQDFRHIPLLVIPGLYYVLQGIDALPKTFKPVGRFLCWALVATSLLFIVRLLHP